MEKLFKEQKIHKKCIKYAVNKNYIWTNMDLKKRYTVQIKKTIDAVIRKINATNLGWVEYTFCHLNMDK